MSRERTTSEVAAEIGVEPYMLRKWKYRGLLKLAPQGVSGQGRSVECLWSEEAFAEAKTHSESELAGSRRPPIPRPHCTTPEV